MGDDLDWRPDPHSPVYVYVQVADRIEADIEAGRLTLGARLLGEREMADQYGIAKATARRALQELRDRQLAVTVPYKGTFIQAKPSADSPAEEDPGQ